MSLATEEFNTGVSPLEEVKKLQDLVRKLEIQNQQLRNKQNRLSKNNTFSVPKEGVKRTNIHGLKISNIEKSENRESSIHEIFHESRNIIARTPAVVGYKGEKGLSLDDIDIIKVNDIDLSDEESWLYTSPRGLTPEQKNESPYKWLRKDVDNPENKELQLARKALASKLDELSVLSPPHQGHVYHTHVENPTITQLRKPQVPSRKSSQAQEYTPCINTRTFTRSKKKQALELLESVAALENIKDVEKHEPPAAVEDNIHSSDVSLDSSLGLITLTDANDVQEVARMQEESLRLSSPISTPKRHSVSSTSGRRSGSSRSSVSDLDGLEHPATSPQVFEDGVHQASTPTFLPPEPPNFSDHSSPSDSPYGSNASLNNDAHVKGDGYRRSLPNLSRTYSGLKPVKGRNFGDQKQQKSLPVKGRMSGPVSDSNLLAVAKTRRDGGSPTRKLRIPSSHLTSPVSSCHESPQCQDSPHNSGKRAESAGHLTPRSALPRPTRATSATRSKSGIPVPSLSKRLASEDSWSEGCF